jgi:hypothetical protein
MSMKIMGRGLDGPYAIELCLVVSLHAVRCLAAQCSYVSAARRALVALTQRGASHAGCQVSGLNQLLPIR